MEICVVGYGTMGKGIAQVFASAGYKVHLVGYNLKKVQKAKNDLMREMYKRKIKNVETVLNNIHPCLGKSSLKRCDLIIEAVPEKMSLKKKIFNKNSKVCKSNAIIASNTSSLSISELAKGCKKPERFIGMHFFNPAPLLPLVEVVKGKKTSNATYKKILKISKSIKKQPVTTKDTPGFIVNSLLMPFINDAIKMADKKIATKEDIDKAIKLGMKLRIGPFELADFIGLDVVLEIIKIIKEKPAASLVKLVKQKKLGRKTKKGFYKYG